MLSTQGGGVTRAASGRHAPTARRSNGAAAVLLAIRPHRRLICGLHSYQRQVAPVP